MLKCRIGMHDYSLVARDMNYTTKDQISRNTFQTIRWMLSFYKCKHCGKRKMVHNQNATLFRGHTGVQRAEADWREAGVLTQTHIKIQPVTPPSVLKMVK